jgi:hypothetical protein
MPRTWPFLTIAITSYPASQALHSPMVLFHGVVEEFGLA